MSTSKAFELLHMDLFGPTQYTSISGNKYSFVIVDDFTRYTWIFFLVDKSDVFVTFKSFVMLRAFTMSLRQPSRELEVTMVVSPRILELMICVMNLEFDGLVERKNRTLIDMARFMLSEYNVSHSFWAEAIKTTCYYIN